MDIQALRQYIGLVWKRYKKAQSRREKTQILDEITANTGWHRKSATRLMIASELPKQNQGRSGGRRFNYSKASRQHLEVLWKSMGRMGARRMKAALPEWLPFYEDCSDEVKREILKMSESTIERILQGPKAQFRRQMNCGTRKPAKPMTEIPIRNKEIQIDSVGHIEADCVAHCGGSLSGQFSWTLNTTDIKSGWTENEAMWGKNGTVVKKAMKEIEQRFPFTVEVFYSDCGNEFLNKYFIEGYIKAPYRIEPLEYYRGRAYHKNDQCYIEQKNNTHVRELMGYARVEWQQIVNKMNNVYRKEWRLLQNFFYPQQRLEEKIRIGSKIKRKMSPAITPYQRILADEDIPQTLKDQLRQQKRKLNPFELQRKLKKKIQYINQLIRTTGEEPAKGKYAI